MPPPGPPKSTVPATKSPLSRSPGNKSPSKSPLLKPLTPSNPPEAGTLADAISKIDSLRLSQPPSAATSPVPSGASSPGTSAAAVPPMTSAAAVRRASGDITKHASPPATPHFGAQSGMYVRMCVAVADPPRLKTLDESTKILRANATEKGLERAPSVSGIGGVGA